MDTRIRNPVAVFLGVHPPREEELSVIDYIKSSKAPSITVASILNKKGLKKKGRSWSKNMVEKIRPSLKKKISKK